MKWFSWNDFDWKGYLIYLAYNTFLAAIGINLVDNPLSWVVLNAMFVLSDTRSYRRGLEQGRNIVLDRFNLLIKERYGIE